MTAYIEALQKTMKAAAKKVEEESNRGAESGTGPVKELYERLDTGSNRSLSTTVSEGKLLTEKVWQMAEIAGYTKEEIEELVLESIFFKIRSKREGRATERLLRQMLKQATRKQYVELRKTLTDFFWEEEPDLPRGNRSPQSTKRPSRRTSR